MQTFAFEGMPDGVALQKLRFVDLGNGRTRLEGTSLVDSFADRDAMARERVAGLSERIVCRLALPPLPVADPSATSS